MSTPILLDCTLRDGGYYNAWDFPASVVSQYLNAMTTNGINYVEIGLRSLKNSKFLGPHAFSKETFLKSLNAPKSLKLAAMLNTGELAAAGDINATLRQLFPVDADKSMLSMVRLATHGEEMEVGLAAANWLHEKGYEVGFNIMQASEFSIAEMANFAEMASKHPIDVLYFADSLGALRPQDAEKIAISMQQNWHGPMGVHMHDNCGLALQNSMAAMNAGISYIDATVTGMGRGPGNVSTEDILVELSHIGSRPLNLEPLLEVINSYFKPLQTKCGWGKNTFYYMSAIGHVHPTYIQNMLADSAFDNADILKVLEYLSSVDSARYSDRIAQEALNFFGQDVAGTWSPRSLGDATKILIIGNGASSAQHKEAIAAYASQDAVFVIALNAKQVIDEGLIDLRVACHPIRLISDLDKIKSLGSPLVAPVSMMDQTLADFSASSVIFDYGIEIESNQLKSKDKWAVIPNFNVGAYALALASDLNPELISLVGFDGFGFGDPRQTAMQHAFDLFQQHNPETELNVLTPSSYNIPQASIYAM
ncbi:aldolase catalytic domain-containing protein [Alphaproteobacteria bacterium]|nr:aldolase catalytic domain-containing protein [Alphaproteobacteria bacterium]